MANPTKAGKSKQAAPVAGTERTIGRRLHALRKVAGVSQEAIGAQGFVSAPGWIKVENGQRLPSEKLLAAFVGWLVQEKFIRAGAKAALVEELTALKYSTHRSPFLAGLARQHLASLPPIAL